MADEREQISGKLREDRRSSNTIDQSLMNRSSSVGDEEMPTENDEEENVPQPGEEYAQLREQQAQSRAEKAKDAAGDAVGKIAGKAASAYVGGGVQGKIVGKVAEKAAKKLVKKRMKLWLIAILPSCLPGCLIVAGFLAMAAIMLTVLADPLKNLGLIFDVIFESF